MGLHAAVLSILFLLAIPLPVQAAAGQPSCLSCHEAHYGNLGSCVDCHRGNPRTDRISIAHDNLIAGRFSYFTLADSPVVKKGATLADTAGCRRCHTTGGQGTILASDLDRLARDTKPEALAASIQHPVALMPDFHFDDHEAAALVNLLLAGSKSRPMDTSEIPLVVHFESEFADTQNVFEKTCGGCHRLLSAKLGGLGEGASGPNLSALLSPFYPRSSLDPGKSRPWSEDDLEKWLKNPRKLRPQTPMPPISIKEEDFTPLKDFFRVPVSMQNDTEPK